MAFCWLSFCCVSFCWVSFCWVSFCWWQCHSVDGILLIVILLMAFCWLSFCWWHSVDCHSVDCHSVECHSIDCHSVECHSVECHSVEFHSVECLSVDVILPRAICKGWYLWVSFLERHSVECHPAECCGATTEAGAQEPNPIKSSTPVFCKKIAFQSISPGLMCISRTRHTSWLSFSLAFKPSLVQ